MSHKIPNIIRVTINTSEDVEICAYQRSPAAQRQDQNVQNEGSVQKPIPLNFWTWASVSAAAMDQRGPHRLCEHACEDDLPSPCCRATPTSTSAPSFFALEPRNKPLCDPRGRRFVRSSLIDNIVQRYIQSPLILTDPIILDLGQPHVNRA